MRPAIAALALLAALLPVHGFARHVPKGCCPHTWRLVLKKPPSRAFSFEIIEHLITNGPPPNDQHSGVYITDPLCGSLFAHAPACTRRTYQIRSEEPDFLVKWTVEWAFVQRTGGNGQLSAYVFRTLTVSEKTRGTVSVSYP